jgi:multidrug resistance efflux pump
MCRDGIILVVDVEVDILKELLLTKLGLLNKELGKLNVDIYYLEYSQKAKKKGLKNLYANLNRREDTLSLKARLNKANAIIRNRFDIAETQMKVSANKKQLTLLYNRKHELREEVAKYNALADEYQIKLYK